MGLLVAIIGLLVVMVYLLFFYKGLGILTAAAITIFAVLYLGLLATLSAFGFFSLSLAGAGACWYRSYDRSCSRLVHSYLGAFPRRNTYGTKRSRRIDHGCEACDPDLD